MKQSKLRNAIMLVALVCFTVVQVKAQNDKKPNILIIWEMILV
jgi:arylsulfatase